MKKKRAVAGGLLLVLGIAQSVSAGTTTVTYHVDPSYMVLVPANTTIPFERRIGKLRENPCRRSTDRRRKMHPGGADLGQKTEKSEWKRRGDPL